MALTEEQSLRRWIQMGSIEVGKQYARLRILNAYSLEVGKHEALGLIHIATLQGAYLIILVESRAHAADG